MLFTILYKLPLILSGSTLNVHFYENDTQLYLSLKTEETFSFTICLKDIKIWMTSNFLFLITGWTEVTVLCSEHHRNVLPNNIVPLDGIRLASSTNVKNLDLCTGNIVKIRHIMSQKDEVNNSTLLFLLAWITVTFSIINIDIDIDTYMHT